MSPPVAVPLIRFNAGETSPRLRGRTDLDWQPAGCEVLLNAISQPQGPATMRPGGWYVGQPRNATAAGTSRLIRFVASVDPLEAYTLEVTDQKMRFWYAGTRTPVLSGGSPLEVATPWLESEIADVKAVGSRDVMWLVHPKRAPQKLVRTAVDTFTLAAVNFTDGPYYPVPPFGTTVTASATTGTVLLSASASLFAATDLGRLFRLSADGSTWGWGKITGVSNSVQASLLVLGTLPTTSATNWHRFGLWSDTTGWPSCLAFYQERLFYGANIKASFPRVDGSASQDFDNFTPGSADNNAIGYIVPGDEDLPEIRDLSGDRSLVVLLSSGERKIGDERSNVTLTPSEPSRIIPLSDEGSAASIRLKGRTLFVNRYKRALFEVAYSRDADALTTSEISIRSDHIGDRAPIAGVTWQNRPYNLLWMWAQNGSLAACTYTPSQSVIAMHRQRKAGAYRGGFAQVETMCTVPGTKGDETWMVVKRTIGGANVRHIEVTADALHDDQPQDEACYLDAAVQTRGQEPAADITFSNITETTATVTASSGVFSSGDVGKRIFAVLEDLTDEMEDGQIRWRRVVLEVTSFTVNTIVGVRLISPWLPPSGTIAAGQWRFGITAATGLAHLEGQTVSVLADGAPLEPRVVQGGQVPLDDVSGIATAGLLYRAIVQPNQLDAGARAGTAHTRRRRVPYIGLEVFRSGRLFAGLKGQLFPVDIRTANDPMDEAVPLFTGTHVIEIPQGDDERRVPWRVEAEGPLPVTLVCAVPLQAIGEGAP